MTTRDNATLAVADAAETKFRAWLDASSAAYLYLDQRPDTFARDFRDSTKRPDFIVGIPTLGNVAIDVKAKTAKRQHFYIDVLEQERMAQFEFAFGIPVWYAILRADTTMAYLIPNASVAGYKRAETPAGEAFAIRYQEFDRFNPETTNFYEALYRATCLPK